MYSQAKRHNINANLCHKSNWVIFVNGTTILKIHNSFLMNISVCQKLLKSSLGLRKMPFSSHGQDMVLPCGRTAEMWEDFGLAQLDISLVPVYN